MAAADCDVASEMTACVVNMQCTCVCWRPTLLAFNFIRTDFVYISHLSVYVKVGVIFSVYIILYIIVMVQHM